MWETIKMIEEKYNTIESECYDVEAIETSCMNNYVSEKESFKDKVKKLIRR